MQIAVIDDEQDMRQSITQWLTLSGFEARSFSGAEEALKVVGPDWPGVVVTDIRMPGMDGMALLKRLRSADSTLPVIMITGHGDVPMAVEAMRIGAFDFLEKPFSPERLGEIVGKAVAARRQALEGRALRKELAEGGSGLMSRLIGASPQTVQLKEDILDLGQADGHVLIEGESGTGKTLIAHALHAVGPRARKPMIRVSLSAFDPASLSARLFGPPEAGQPPIPAFEEARGGTLVCEDVETLPAEVQSRFLTALEDLGTPPETRIISICNTGQGTAALEEALRPDLFFRIVGLKLTVPALRERGEDILQLFTLYATQYAEEYGCNTPELSASEAAALLQAPWPGNVRQLMTLAERAVLSSRREDGSIASFLMNDNDQLQSVITTSGKPLKEHVESFERMLIDSTMRRHKGQIAKVMDELCLPRRTLNEKMAKYGLSRADYV